MLFISIPSAFVMLGHVKFEIRKEFRDYVIRVSTLCIVFSWRSRMKIRRCIGLNSASATHQLCVLNKHRTFLSLRSLYSQMRAIVLDLPKL